MKTVSIFLLALTAVAFAKVKPGLRIINGYDAARNQFPYTVLVNDTSRADYAGAGEIIGRRWVSTVAHWLTVYGPFELQVVAGILKRSDRQIDNQQTLDVVEIIIHPEFSSKTWFNDIALLRLSSYLVYGPNVQPIPLAPKNYQATGLATFTGWGSISASKVTHLDNLQYANVKILSESECIAAITAASISLSSYDPTFVLCTNASVTDGTQSGCTDDSGGPLVAENYLVGIISSYRNCKSPNLHTNVSAVREWILDNTNGEIKY